MSRIFFILGSLFGALGVAMGAYGAHGGAQLLELNNAIITFGKATRYNMYHALVLLTTAWALVFIVSSVYFFVWQNKFIKILDKGKYFRIL